MNPEKEIDFEICVSCGEPVPEGRMVCYACEMGYRSAASCKAACPPKGIRKWLWFKKENIDEHGE